MAKGKTPQVNRGQMLCLVHTRVQKPSFKTAACVERTGRREGISVDVSNFPTVKLSPNTFEDLRKHLEKEGIFLKRMHGVGGRVKL